MNMTIVYYCYGKVSDYEEELFSELAHQPLLRLISGHDVHSNRTKNSSDKAFMFMSGTKHVFYHESERITIYLI